jgi:hypothetical protein
MAPLSGGYSASPLGAGNTEMAGTATSVHLNGEPRALPFTHLRLLVGLSQKMDVGLSLDQNTTTAIAKYSLSASENSPWRWAFLGGFTRIASTSGWSAGVINSFTWRPWEIDSLVRYNEATLNSADFDYKYMQTTDSGLNQFLLFNLTAKYWLTPKLYLGADWAVSPIIRGVKRSQAVSQKNISSLMIGFRF